MPPRILHVVTNVAHYTDPSQPTGLWLSELSHAWDLFARQGYVQTLASPLGGATPLEPRSLKWPNLDDTARAWLADAGRMDLLRHTAAANDIRAQDFDAIYFTGGHAVMWDFPGSQPLQRITRDIYEHGGVVAAVCHGYCGLLETRLSNGQWLVQGRRLTGFSWREEMLAGVARKVPYDAEARMRERGALYEKAWLPFVSKVVVDGRLITGQNPQSARATAHAVVQQLG